MRERKWFFLSLILHKMSERKLILKEIVFPYCVFRKWREIVYFPWCRCHCMPFSPKMLKNLYRWPASRLDKQRSARNFSRDRTGSPPRTVVFYGFWNVYLELIFITVAFEDIEQWPACKSSADCAIYKRFGQRLFCFDCLFTNLQVPGPPIADSWHITFSRRKWRHI